jgi:hypothetical protein
MTKSDQITTKQLRKTALAVLEASGKGTAQRIHRRSQLYQVGDVESTFRLRTNRERVLILATDAPDAKVRVSSATRLPSKRLRSSLQQ